MVRQPTLTYKKMTLTEIMFGTFVPPKSTNVIRHNFGLTGGARYEPPVKPLSQRYDLPPEKRLAGSYKKIYSVLKAQTKPICSAQMEKKVPWSRNHCSIIMMELCKRGLATRYKTINNGTAIYMYSAKVNDAS